MEECVQQHNLLVVTHIQLRKLLKKGPKYRISSDIDFESCKKELADSLLKYSKQWCVREGVDANALHPWLLKISQLVQKRINFFVSNPLMIPKNKLSLTPSIKTAFSKIHDTYVLVPADKAANNVIIV